MLTVTELARVKEIEARLREIELERTPLQNELIDLRERCEHLNLPKREPGEEYRDICPDCGFVSYCYVV